MDLRFTPEEQAFLAANGITDELAPEPGVSRWVDAEGQARELPVARGELAWDTIDALHRQVLDHLLPLLGLAVLGLTRRWRSPRSRPAADGRLSCVPACVPCAISMRC